MCDTVIFTYEQTAGGQRYIVKTEQNSETFGEK